MLAPFALFSPCTQLGAIKLKNTARMRKPHGGIKSSLYLATNLWRAEKRKNALTAQKKRGKICVYKKKALPL